MSSLITTLLYFIFLICILIITASAADKKEANHYEVLGVGNKASLDEIKKSYRKLAKVSRRFLYYSILINFSTICKLIVV